MKRFKIETKQVGGLFAFIGARISRKLYDYLNVFSFIISVPISLLFYLLSKIFDYKSNIPTSVIIIGEKL